MITCPVCNQANSVGQISCFSKTYVTFFCSECCVEFQPNKGTIFKPTIKGGIRKYEPMVRTDVSALSYDDMPPTREVVMSAVSDTGTVFNFEMYNPAHKGKAQTAIMGGEKDVSTVVYQ